jgi:hypothetical protein
VDLVLDCDIHGKQHGVCVSGVCARTQTAAGRTQPPNARSSSSACGRADGQHELLPRVRWRECAYHSDAQFILPLVGNDLHAQRQAPPVQPQWHLCTRRPPE